MATLQTTIQQNMEKFWKLISTTQLLQICELPEYLHTVSSIPDALFNGVFTKNIGRDTMDKTIKNLKEFYNEKGLAFCWWINSEDKTLAEKLAQAGMTTFGSIQGMALDISDSNFEKIKICYKRVISKEDFNDWIQPISSAFHMSPIGTQSYQEIFYGLSQLSENMQHFTAYEGSNPIASCTLFLDSDSQTAGIYNCGTMPLSRKNGAITALTLHALDVAKNLGYPLVVLQASPMSKNLFSRVGFQTFSSYEVFLG